MHVRSGRPWWWRLVFPVIALAVLGPVVPSARAAPAVCGVEAPPSAIVRVYARAGVPELATGRSTLSCGTSRYGLRHIAARHAQDWGAVADGTGWAAFADTAVLATLAQPDAVRCDARRNTCAFTRSLDAGVVALVAVAREDGKVITAYPLA